MAIPFTDKEMKKAWDGNLSASQISPRTNAHRLLLFYAVECGLKAVLMARQKTRRTDLCTDINECKHNINKLLSKLGAGGSLSLPPEIFIQEIFDTRKNKEERKLNPGQINELWRYGGKVIAIVNKDGKVVANDEDIENKLREISKWIAGELERL
ncbi:hypothetical protein IQ231_20980 [Cuspidothrix issatschenkoi LEGE 03284]|uniref:hypothetical protein n=1 Tax=Cuspidothrix issatschenkoi TaxID=230752 RepID=UPI00187FB90D|nr:hypothetical protein [Cuspidothrix issatschenkoi]MBE9234070.1 hypothetical protein [Cuspidothrix issatschenkoi LEGE 03284]